MINLQIANVHNIGMREEQQDSFGISDLSNECLCNEKGIFAVLADGMGGLANGAEVSAIITSDMLKYFTDLSLDNDIPAQLLNMLYSANTKVKEFIIDHGNQLSGSTLVAVNIRDNFMHFISVGDSRIYLLRGGALLQMNREHTYGSELDEKAARGEITLGEARNNILRNALTSFVGMENITLIDRSLRPTKLLPGDRIFLMSDGIFTTLTEEEMIGLSPLNTYEAAITCENAILEKGKTNQDNFTAIIIDVW